MVAVTSLYLVNPRRMRKRGLRYVCVCVPGENKLLRSLTQVIRSAYSIYKTNARFKTCDFAKNARVESYDDKYLSRRSLASSPGRFIFQLLNARGRGKKRPGIHCTGSSAHAH